MNHGCIPAKECGSVPVLRYLKDPVEKLNDLYVRYPGGGEYGWFALVVEKGTFAWWNTAFRRWNLITSSDGSGTSSDLGNVTEAAFDSVTGAGMYSYVLKEDGDEQHGALIVAMGKDQGEEAVQVTQWRFDRGNTQVRTGTQAADSGVVTWAAWEIWSVPKKGSGENSEIFNDKTNNEAKGDYAHAEGGHTKATGAYSHVEGYLSESVADTSHAEGYQNKVYGNSGHAEGSNNNVYTESSHAEGINTKAGLEGQSGDDGKAAHAEGEGTVASGRSSHSEGRDTVASGKYAHAEGELTESQADQAHAEGWTTIASGNASHAEGSKTTASGEASHVEGFSNNATGRGSHAEGENSSATGNQAHAEGWNAVASGGASHSEGGDTKAQGDRSHAEGSTTTASGEAAHAEGFETKAKGRGSHAEGEKSLADGDQSHAEGWNTQANGGASHAEGGDSKAHGDRSHAEGTTTQAKGYASHTEGSWTVSENEAEHAEGKYNKSNTGTKKTIHSVGIGTSDTDRKNAHEIMENGDHYVYGVGGYDGKNPDTAKTLQEVISGSRSIIDLGNITSDDEFDAKTTPGFYKYTFGTPSKDGYLVVTTDNNIVQEGGGFSALYQIRFEGLNILYRSLATSGSWDASFKKLDLNTTIGGKEGTGGQREAIDNSNYKLQQFIEPGFYRFQPTVFERFTDRPTEITSVSGSRNYALLVLGANFTAADYPNSNTVSQILMDFPSVSGGSSTYEPTMWVRIVNTTDGNPGTYGTWKKIGGGSSVEVVQTTGQSTTSVMSQKAVTNTIGNLSSDVNRDEGLYEDVDTLGETVSRTSTNGEMIGYINHRIEEYKVSTDEPNAFTYDDQVHTLKLAQFTVHPQEGDLSFIADNSRGVLLDPTWSYVNFYSSNEPRYFSARIGGGKCVLCDSAGNTNNAEHYIQLYAEAAYSPTLGGIAVTIFAEYKLETNGAERNPLYINGSLAGYLRIWIV